MVNSLDFLCPPLQPSRRRRRRIGSVTGSLYDSTVQGELSSVSEVKNKDSVVRIVLASKMVEVYDSAISAHSVLQKYPGLCLARPEVFKMPHESLVGPKEMLLPGQKFYLVPTTTVKKLQQRHSKLIKPSEEEVSVKTINSDKMEAEGTVCSAKEFSISKDIWSQCHVQRFGNGSKQVQKKKAFNPPINRPMWRKGVLDGWKPTLTSIEEISP